MKRQRRVCPHCGSADIVKDAVAAWDYEAQELVLAGVQDHEVCEGCGRDGDDLSYADAD